MVEVSSPPSLGELEQVLEARKTRLSESLRVPRAALLQKLGDRLYDLRFAADTTDFTSYERTRLETITTAYQEIEEARHVAAGYARSLAQATAAMQAAKGAYERCNPLTEAPGRQKAIERYHLAKIESEVFQEAVDAMQVGVTEAERGLTRRMQWLQSEFDVYVNAKITAMTEEAQRTLEEAEGKLRLAADLKRRAEIFPQEFRARYGLKEGNDGAPKA